ncbi:MAG: ABC transporter ATP-binding protein [Streptococcaceae bacterium]|jgi:putative ABC transport system ATP-binding protein|nr:ABC transporter ATP-binding protein [Streptococcaceae bacterium]
MKPALNINNLHKTFFKGTINENHVLKGIDFTANQGDFITVIGGNGAGKSTLLNAIAGSFLTDEGSILIDDVDVTKMPEHKRSKLISRVFQDPRLGTATRMTIEENLAIASIRGQKRGLKFGKNAKSTQFFHEQVKQLDLGLEDRMMMDMGLLSGGQRQALTLLMATLTAPKMLLLDEHTAALDPKTAEQVLNLTQKLVEKQNLTTFMITHNMQDALRFGNRLIMLHQGQIVVDLKGEAKQKASVHDLIELFKEKSGTLVNDDAVLLG